MENQVGNFGTLPYGKSVHGYIFYSITYGNNKKNTWCDSNDLPKLDDDWYTDMEQPDNSIFIMVDQ